MITFPLILWSVALVFHIRVLKFYLLFSQTAIAFGFASLGTFLVVVLLAILTLAVAEEVSSNSTMLYVISEAKGVGRKFSRGSQRKKIPKNSKKRPKNSTFKPLSTISVPCMKMQAGSRSPCSRCRRPCLKQNVLFEFI